MSTVLEVRDAVRTYRRGPELVHAVDRVSLRLHDREAIALLGPSGSGKTTLMNLIVGWEALESGEVRWNAPVTEPTRWDHVAVVPQRLGLLQELTIGANIRWPLRLLGRLDDDNAARVEELEDRLGLTGLRHRRVTEVSLGEQQRTALARAIVVRPVVLIADEPTGHQDEASAEAVFEALEAARREGTGMLIATHDQRYLEHADATVRLHDGAVVPD